MVAAPTTANKAMEAAARGCRLAAAQADQAPSVSNLGIPTRCLLAWRGPAAPQAYQGQERRMARSEALSDPTTPFPVLVGTAGRILVSSAARTRKTQGAMVRGMAAASAVSDKAASVSLMVGSTGSLLVAAQEKAAPTADTSSASAKAQNCRLARDRTASDRHLCPTAPQAQDYSASGGEASSSSYRWLARSGQRSVVAEAACCEEPATGARICGMAFAAPRAHSPTSLSGMARPAGCVLDAAAQAACRVRLAPSKASPKIGGMDHCRAADYDLHAAATQKTAIRDIPATWAKFASSRRPLGASRPSAAAIEGNLYAASDWNDDGPASSLIYGL